jgi:formate hydrogenlyase transcriptional activator
MASLEHGVGKAPSSRGNAERGFAADLPNSALGDESVGLAQLHALDDLKRELEVVRKAERQLRKILNTMPTLAWCSHPDGSTEFLNQRWYEYTGLSQQQAEGWGWKVTIHPDDLEELIEKWQGLLNSGEPGEFEARMRRHDGVFHWFLFRAEPLHDDLHNVVRWYGTNTDIEDLRRAQALLSTEKHTLEMITEGTSVQEILESLCTSFDAMSPDFISSILLMDAGSEQLRFVAGARIPKAWAEFITPLTIGPCVGSCGTAAFFKKRVISSDISIDPLWTSFRDVALRSGLGSAWSQPILSKDNTVLGTFCIYSPTPRTPEPSDIQLIEGATNVALIAIEKGRIQAELVDALEEIKKTQEQLKRDEEEFRRITDAIAQIVVVMQPEGRIIYANQMALDYTGLTLQDVQAESFRARVFHPEDIERVREDRKEALLKGIPFRNEQRVLRKDGKYRWFLHQYNPLLDDNGKVIRWYTTGTDIEDRKRAEDRMQNENVALREDIERASMFEEIVGSSEPLRVVLAQVTKVAPTDSTVLILGETGTGKELIARAIHNRSRRSKRAFIRVNCAAIPRDLIASELFGHEKGAFTGALQRRLGRFESADGGTIFLDEVGDLPAETQVALLRVLQEREIERLGGSHPIAVDVRVVAATHRDLDAAVREGVFRHDLFYRLNVVPIRVPPLRERVEDISLLVEYLIDRFGTQNGKSIRSINKRTLELFQAYSWPGNVRELQNVIERAVILSDGDTFSVDEAWLTRVAPKSAANTVPLVASLVGREREMLEAALRETEGRIGGPNGAAAKLGLPRQTRESKIRKLGINRHQFKIN